MWLSFCRGVVDLRCRKIFTTPKDRRTPDYFMAGLGKKLKSLGKSYKLGSKGCLRTKDIVGYKWRWFFTQISVW